MDIKSAKSGPGRNLFHRMIPCLVIIFFLPVVACLAGIAWWGASVIDHQRTFHPTGQILFHCDVLRGTSNGLCMVNADGSAPQIIYPSLARTNGTHYGYAYFKYLGTARDNYLSWSPDWQRVAFTAITEDNDYVLMLAQARGYSVAELTDKLGGIGNLSWSPDGKTLAFTKFSDTGKAHGIYTIRADGSSLTQISTFGAGPAWSPDGKHIAFTNEPAGIYILDTDTGSQRQIANAISAKSLTWSPDNSKIVFSTYHDPDAKSDGLGLINADGSNQKLLKGEFSLPAWSPDGTKIAYLCGDASLCVMNADGSGQASLGSGSEPFVWSPDGQYIVYNSGTGFCPLCYSGPAGGLSLMKADGSQKTELIQQFYGAFVAGFNSPVAWRPAP